MRPHKRINLRLCSYNGPNKNTRPSICFYPPLFAVIVAVQFRFTLHWRCARDFFCVAVCLQNASQQPHHLCWCVCVCVCGVLPSRTRTAPHMHSGRRVRFTRKCFQQVLLLAFVRRAFRPGASHARAAHHETYAMSCVRHPIFCAPGSRRCGGGWVAVCVCV